MKKQSKIRQYGTNNALIANELNDESLSTISGGMICSNCNKWYWHKETHDGKTKIYCSTCSRCLGDEDAGNKYV